MCTFNWPHIERQYNWSTDTHKPQVFRRIIGLTTSLPLSTAHTDDDYTTQLIRKLLSKPRHELCLKRVPYFYHNRDIFPRIHHLLSSTTPKHISRAYIAEPSKQTRPSHRSRYNPNRASSARDKAGTWAAHRGGGGGGGVSPWNRARGWNSKSRGAAVIACHASCACEDMFGR